MSTIYIIFELFGWLSIIFHIHAFATSHRNKMLVSNLTSTTLLGLSMIPYGGLNGTAICFFSVISKIAGLKEWKKEAKDAHKALIGILFGFSFFIIFGQEGVAGLLPSISLIFILMADLQQDILRMKLWYYGSAICWIIYAISITSLAAFTYDLIGICILTLSVYKITKFKKIQCSTNNPPYTN